MFTYSIDNKEEIVDSKGNTIVNLAASIFSKNAGRIDDYEIVRMDKMYVMRPDKVSWHMYENDKNTEFILKYSGISNPFTLADDDVLMIPNESQAEGMMAYNNAEAEQDDKAGIEAQIRNYYKFVNQEYKSDRSSYDKLKDKVIPSGVISGTNENDYIVPYISEDGRTAVTIRNGRMYFGEDSGLTSANQVTASTAEGVTKSVQSIINNTITELSNSNCIYNGTSVADFVRSNINK